MKKKNISLLLVTLLVMLSSCSEFYSDEQYEHYVSFKAPTSTVSRIRLKYRKGQPSPYRLPLIVAGSTMNNKDIDVHVGIDNDTSITMNITMNGKICTTNSYPRIFILFRIMTYIFRPANVRL